VQSYKKNGILRLPADIISKKWLQST